MKSYFSIFIVLMIFTTVMYSMSIIGVNALNKNTLLDEDSIGIIGNLTTTVNNNFDINSSFGETTSVTVPENETGSYSGTDTFAQQFFEGKTESDQKAGIVSSITKAPDAILLSFGLPESAVATFRNILLLIIGVVVSFATYRAIFGGGRVTDN